MTPEDILEQFKRFVGRAVNCHETINTLKLGSDVVEIEDITLADNDATVLEIQELANKLNLKLRVMTSTMLGTCDYMLDRVNIRVDRDGDRFAVSGVGVG